MTDFTLQAQKVLDAFLADRWESTQDRQRLAVALRAAADQLTPHSVEDMPGAAFCRNKILDIAAELENL